MQILGVMSQFLLKGHKMFNFPFAFFLKISEALEACISEMEEDIYKWQTTASSSPFLMVFHIRK